MPDATTPLADWLDWLETLSPHEIDLGLERVDAVFKRLSLPRPKRVLTIGGTNGKGSSVVMADALLRDAGYTTGAYTSPHLTYYNERICVSGTPASDADIVAALQAVDDARQGEPLTYFEFGTLAAMVVFARAKVDVWILEVGLGGRLDATNVVAADAVLITNVSLDHCDWLGDDVETIAAEKAGIMRPGRPAVFAGAQVPAAIREHATRIGADLLLPPVREFATLALRGDFQRRNAAGVVALLEAANLSRATDDDRLQRVLQQVGVAGRLQEVSAVGRRWLFDVAHNPAAAEALADVLRDDGERCCIIIGVLDDKDVDGIVAPLLPYVRNWISVTPSGHRAVAASELARRIANQSGRACQIAASHRDALEIARRDTAENDRILVTGSFLTVGPLMDTLDSLDSQSG